MRTVLVPRSATVASQLERLPGPVRDVAERVIGALALEPDLGRPVGRGLLHDVEARVVLFDRTTIVRQLGGGLSGRRRRGDEDPDAGPRWRVVYWHQVHRGREIRFLEVLAVGLGHAPAGQASAYELAAEHVQERQEGGGR